MKTWKSSQNLVTGILIALLIQACGLFISPYNATSLEYLTRLKAFHLKFIDDFTASEIRTFSESQVRERFDVGDFLFREALEYATRVTEDKLRVNAFQILYDEFKDDTGTLLEQKDLFSPAAAKVLKGIVESNYNSAIEGEQVRRNGPAN